MESFLEVIEIINGGVAPNNVPGCNFTDPYYNSWPKIDKKYDEEIATYITTNRCQFYNRCRIFDNIDPCYLIKYQKLRLYLWHASLYKACITTCKITGTPTFFYLGWGAFYASLPEIAKEKQRKKIIKVMRAGMNTGVSANTFSMLFGACPVPNFCSIILEITEPTEKVIKEIRVINDITAKEIDSYLRGLAFSTSLRCAWIRGCLCT
jgi:hypothetical protein